MSQRWKRIQIALLVTAICVSLVGWLAWREVHPQQLDASLIAGIKHNDTRAALAALHAHANPNAHDRNEAPLSMWQFLRMRWRQMRGEKIAPVPKGLSALALAVEQNNTTVVEALVNAGARDVGEKIFDDDVSASHLTLLMFAASQNKPAIIRALVRSGADVNARDEVKATALFHCDDGLSGQALLDCGADIAVKDNIGKTIFDYSINDTTSRSLYRVLLERGAVEQGAKDRGAISEAIRGHDMATLKILIKAGCDVNAYLEYEVDPPLIEAVKSSGHFKRDIVLLLIRHGANVNFRGAGGDSPLYWAALGSQFVEIDNQSPVIVKALLDRGAQINEQDDGGRTPLMAASLSQYPALVRLLLQRGAKVNLRDKDGHTALTLVKQKYSWKKVGHQSNIIRLLKAAGAKE